MRISSKSPELRKSIFFLWEGLVLKCTPATGIQYEHISGSRTGGSAVIQYVCDSNFSQHYYIKRESKRESKRERVTL